MTSNKVTINDTEKPKLSKTKISTVTDDVNTESYHTSGIFRFVSLKNIFYIYRSNSNDE